MIVTNMVNSRQHRLLTVSDYARRIGDLGLNRVKQLLDRVTLY